METTQALPKELESTAHIRFQDCDPFQHLNNARYIDYVFNAREDQLIKYYGFSIFEHSKTSNAGWVVTKTQIAYLFPAGVAEEVVIRTRLLHMTETTLVVEGVMFDKVIKRPKAVLWVEFTYVSLVTGRTTKHPDDLMRLFEEVVVADGYQPDGFDQRVDDIKRQHRKEPAAASN